MGVGTQRRNREEAARIAKATTPAEVAAPAAEQQNPSNEPPKEKVKEPSFEDLQKEAESRGIDHKALKLNSKKKIAEAIAEFDEAAKKAAEAIETAPAPEDPPLDPPATTEENPSAGAENTLPPE